LLLLLLVLLLLKINKLFTHKIPTFLTVLPVAGNEEDRGQL